MSLDQGHVFFTELHLKPGKLKVTVDLGCLPGCNPMEFCLPITIVIIPDVLVTNLITEL